MEMFTGPETRSVFVNLEKVSLWLMVTTTNHIYLFVFGVLL